MKTLAIIGTAGRKEEFYKLHLSHWQDMQAAARKVIELESITNLVSGGAAWSDHVALELSQEYPCHLFLPGNKRDDQTCAYYHRAFSRALGRDTWAEVQRHQDRTLKGSFKDRNTYVAQSADVFLAMTFGNKRQIKPGGTQDTVDKMLNMNKSGYHLDLNTIKLYSLSNAPIPP